MGQGNEKVKIWLISKNHILMNKRRIKAEKILIEKKGYRDCIFVHQEVDETCRHGDHATKIRHKSKGRKYQLFFDTKPMKTQVFKLNYKQIILYLLRKPVELLFVR